MRGMHSGERRLSLQEQNSVKTMLVVVIVNDNTIYVCLTCVAPAPVSSALLYVLSGSPAVLLLTGTESMLPYTREYAEGIN